MNERNDMPPVPYAVSGVIDAHPPRRIARLVEDVGVRKARMATTTMVVLGFIAGVYIAFGAMLHTLILTEPSMAGAFGRIAGGVAISLGFALVILAGAELFTGNMLSVMAWAHGRITLTELRRAWGYVFFANFAGAIVTAWIAREAGIYGTGEGSMAAVAVALGEEKVAVGFWPSFLRGILANILVCLAVWMCFASHTLTDRILAILLPITAFSALGFEHSVTNMYILPAAMMLGSEVITLRDLVWHILPVTLGNIVGGGVFVAAVYWAVYLRRLPGRGRGGPTNG